MTELYKGVQQGGNAPVSKVVHAVQMAEDCLATVGIAHQALRQGVYFANHALSLLKRDPNCFLYHKALAAKVGALFRLGEFEHAVSWLRTQDQSSLNVTGYLIKGLFFLGDSRGAEAMLTERIRKPQADASVLTVDQFSSEVALLFARAMSLSIHDVSILRPFLAEKRQQLEEQFDARQSEFYDRYEFILGVVEAKCFLTEGKVGQAAQALSRPAALLSSSDAFNSNTAIMEFFAVSGDIKLLQGDSEGARRYFEALSTRFATAEDSPAYFKKSVWGLIDSYAGNGRSDRLDRLGKVLSRRGERHGALLDSWCLALGGYADARIGKMVDPGEWGRSIVAAGKAVALHSDEMVVLSLRRAYYLMTRCESANDRRVGAVVFTDLLEKLVQNPDQLGIMDKWRVSKMFNRWFADALLYGTATRQGAAEMIVNILGKSQVFVGQVGNYKLVIGERNSVQQKEPQDLIVEL